MSVNASSKRKPPRAKLKSPIAASNPHAPAVFSNVPQNQIFNAFYGNSKAQVTKTPVKRYKLNRSAFASKRGSKNELDREIADDSQDTSINNHNLSI